MKVSRTKAEVTNANSRPEGSGEGINYATDLSIRFSVHRSTIDEVVRADVPFTDQYYAGDDPVLPQLCPIKWHEKVKDLRATLYVDDKELKFEPCQIQAGMEWTPQGGEYVEVVCKLQVHPSTPTESGKLDFLAKRWIEVEIEPLNTDMDDGGSNNS